MLAVQAALRQPPQKAKSVLEGLETRRSNLGEVEQTLVPNAQKSNAARIEVLTARAELLQALAAK
jgi:hypothetical protein